LRKLDRDPANERWQAFIGDYVERFDPHTHARQPPSSPAANR
jgi:hypothetical protein